MTKLTRRRALRTAGLVALGLVPLAGCSGSGTEPEPETESGSGGSGGSSEPTETDPPDSSDGSDESGGSDDASGSGESSGDSGASTAVPDEVATYLSNVGNYSGVSDQTGSESVTVTVGAEGNGGNLAFGPPAVRVSTGTEVTWEWNGKGGAHNVVAEDGSFESELVTEEGHTFSHTFTESGVSTYYCQPHKALGMKGAVIVE